MASAPYGIKHNMQIIPNRDTFWSYYRYNKILLSFYGFFTMHEITLGKYRHYKGDFYEVLGIARHSETLEPLVVYRALYGDFGLWVRPLSMFTETIEFNGQTQSRFAFIG